MSVTSDPNPWNNYMQINELHPEPSDCVLLSTNHQIAYQEYGSALGFPMFYFHDSGSSRLECTFFHRAAKAFGYRLIAVDRPGIGHSDFYSNACPEMFARDVVELADLLAIDKFAVLSLGSGGIFALMLAYHFKHRVTEVLSLGGVPGSSFKESEQKSTLARYWQRIAPQAINLFIRTSYAWQRERNRHSIDHIKEQLCDADRRALQKSRTSSILNLDQREVLRQGAKGLAQDLANCYRKLDFMLENIEVPVTIWQGKSDHLSMRTDCEFMRSRIPSSRYFRVPNRGYFFFLEGMDSVFARMQVHRPASMAFAA